jgi:hypothetical protein
MQARIRIIKRGGGTDAKCPSANDIEKAHRQPDRETATTVKGWIAEWEARNSALKTAASLLVRSLDCKQNSPRRFAALKG